MTVGVPLGPGGAPPPFLGAGGADVLTGGGPPGVLVAGGIGVLVEGGPPGVLVAGGTGVLVAGGTGVFVAGGIGVLVAGGTGVLVAGGAGVSVGRICLSGEAEVDCPSRASNPITVIISASTINTRISDLFECMVVSLLSQSVLAARPSSPQL